MPEKVDAALLRRFSSRVQVALPNEKSRTAMLLHFLQDVNHCLQDSELQEIAHATEGCSGSDIEFLVRNACE